MLRQKLNYNIYFCLFLLIISVQGCAFGFSNKEAENLLQEFVKRVSEAGNTMSTNEIKEVCIKNTSGIDIAVFCQAYIRADELGNRLHALQIPAATIDAIQGEVSAQDGIYLFLLKKGRIVAKGPLGGEVSLSEPVLGITLQDLLSIEIVRLDQKWRYLQIRIIK